MTVSFPSPSVEQRLHYYNLQTVPDGIVAKPYECLSCNRNFYTRNQLKHHEEDHVPCPYQNCLFGGEVKALQTHIDEKHLVRSSEALLLDNEEWIKQRKSRFPTGKRAELRREILHNKWKRGERMGLRANKKVDNSNFEITEVPANRFNRPTFHRKPRRNRFFVPKYTDLDLYASDGELKDGIHAFKGTKQFYESIGETSLFGVKEKDVQEKESDFCISDEDEWDGSIKNNNGKKEKLHNALGSLMGSYGSESEPEDDPINNGESNVSLKICAKVESVLSRCEDRPKPTRKRLQHKGVSNESELLDKREKRIHIKKTIKRPINKFQKRKRQSLLEKLLKPEIMHERNLLLQCVNFIVQHNFFEVADSTSRSTP